MLRACTLGCALVLVAVAQATGQTPDARITTGEIDASVRFLSSDLLEGRAPGTRGGRLAQEYLASELQASGVLPGIRSSYFQPLSMNAVATDRATFHATAAGLDPAGLRFGDDVVAWTGTGSPATHIRGEVVFVGYGASAPEYQWDDFKGVDLKDKVLLILVGDPPTTVGEPARFGGGAMTYYGRWTYKFEEAERRGAAGALIVHTAAAAGYPWHTVIGSWGGTWRLPSRDPTLPPALPVEGWITDSAATRMLASAGLDLSMLRAAASMRTFQPVLTGITLDIGFASRVDHVETANVVGLVRGRDPALRKEFVVYTAHWDHLGIGPAVGGDSIYNGAEDNASGVADLLAIARAAARAPAPRRSLLFLFTTGEESGLLGATYFLSHPPVPLESLVADLNIDGGNLLGPTRDVDAIGQRTSSLGPALSRFAARRGLRVSPERHQEQGQFYRADHYAFARAGIPAVSIGAGADFVGQPPEWGRAQQEIYASRRYHQPSDEYRADFDLRGAVQLSDLILGFGAWLANTDGIPTWRPGGEYQRRAPVSAAAP
jgi:Zn-dependent M28 family amino/carboxypeptidase